VPIIASDEEKEMKFEKAKGTKTFNSCNSHMQAMTRRIKKALRTGSMDADSALIIFLRDLIRPKSRTTLTSGHVVTESGAEFERAI
jgi:hypothetical protein